MAGETEQKGQAGKTRNHVRPMTGVGYGPVGERRRQSRPTAARLAKPSPPLKSWPAFLRDFVRVAGPYWRSEERGRVIFFTVALFLLTVMQVVVPVAINRWMRALFDALEVREMQRFAMLSGVLLVIIVANVTITNFHLRVKRRIQIGWRDWLTRRVTSAWMEAGRHYELTYLPGPHDNPDGRIAEDVRNATEYAIDLAHALVYDLLLLISFTDILWSLSQAPYIVLSGVPYYVPGYLVWLAIIYAGIGTLVALMLGRALVRSADRRQTAEADFRFGLSHARENALGIALASGEADIRQRFTWLFRGVVGAWNDVTLALAHMFYYSSTWSVLSQVFPIVVVAPRYIAGLITLGGLMQSAQAFQQMVSALSWAIDNLGKVADWRASSERVFGLHEAVRNFDVLLASSAANHITVVPSERMVLAFRDFATRTPAGAPELGPVNFEIHEGDRVLVMGETGAASTVLKAIAGIWPWGSGRIERPESARLLFMPPRPYLPTGKLREAIDFPSEHLTESAISKALERVGLAVLAQHLEERGNWDQVLTVEQQQRVGFARLLLKRPDWIFMEEAADALDPAGHKAMLEILRVEFPKATIIALGRTDALADFETRRFYLERKEGLVTLREETVAAA
ncbi:MAG TPA: ABC transporter ATP-binding protein/permease [Candidatus Cybelea sp.]|nr:ABC transporter ATP-binding protein/permease [Candidatus Cybelea sp.]